MYAIRVAMVLFFLFQVFYLLTKPVAVVNHLPRVFTGQWVVCYIQWVEIRYVVSSDLFFSAQHTRLACNNATANPLVSHLKSNKKRKIINSYIIY